LCDLQQQEMAKQQRKHAAGPASTGDGASASASANGSGGDTGKSGKSERKSDGLSGRRKSKAVSASLYGVAAVVAVAVIGVLAYMYVYTQPSISDRSRNPQDGSINKKSNKGIDFDGYVQLSKANNWEHANPIDRLEYLARVYSQSYTVTEEVCNRFRGITNSTVAATPEDIQAAKFQDYLQRDFAFVANALMNTDPGDPRVFDVTNTFVESIEGTNRLIFKVLKKLLSRCGLG
jgi:hypothetical protein